MQDEKRTLDLINTYLVVLFLYETLWWTNSVLASYKLNKSVPPSLFTHVVLPLGPSTHISRSTGQPESTTSMHL